MPGNFFDTNVLVYLASGNPAEADRAEQLVAEGSIISMAVAASSHNSAGGASFMSGAILGRIAGRNATAQLTG